MDAKQQEQGLSMQGQIMLLKKFSKITEYCINKVATKQTASMSDTEKTLLTYCVQRYFDTELFLGMRMQAKAKKMQEQAGMQSQ